MLAGCTTQPGKEVNANLENTEITEETNAEESVENNASTISTLCEILDINNLDNCTVAVSFNKGDVYVDDSGKAVMNATVYSYELYDMVSNDSTV